MLCLSRPTPFPYCDPILRQDSQQILIGKSFLGDCEQRCHMEGQSAPKAA